MALSGSDSSDPCECIKIDSDVDLRPDYNRDGIGYFKYVSIYDGEINTDVDLMPLRQDYDKNLYGIDIAFLTEATNVRRLVIGSRFSHSRCNKYIYSMCLEYLLNDMWSGESRNGYWLNPLLEYHEKTFDENEQRHPGHLGRVLYGHEYEDIEYYDVRSGLPYICSQNILAAYMNLGKSSIYQTGEYAFASNDYWANVGWLYPVTRPGEPSCIIEVVDTGMLYKSEVDFWEDKKYRDSLYDINTALFDTREEAESTCSGGAADGSGSYDTSSGWGSGSSDESSGNSGSSDTSSGWGSGSGDESSGDDCIEIEKCDWRNLDIDNKDPDGILFFMPLGEEHADVDVRLFSLIETGEKTYMPEEGDEDIHKKQVINFQYKLVEVQPNKIRCGYNGYAYVVTRRMMSAFVSVPSRWSAAPVNIKGWASGQYIYCSIVNWFPLLYINHTKVVMNKRDLSSNSPES